MHKTFSFQLLLGCLGVFAYVASHAIPGTGALRSLGMLLCIIYLLARWKQPRPQIRWLQQPVVLCLAALTLWMGLRTFWLGDASPQSPSLFMREWGKVLLLGSIATAMAMRAFTAEARMLYCALFAGFFLHVLSTLLHVGWHLAGSGILSLGNSLFGNYGYVSPLVDAALAILLAEVLHRMLHGRRLLPIHAYGLAACLLLTLAASLLLRAKGSMLSMLLMAVLFIAIVATRPSRYRTSALVMSMLILIAASVLSVRIENRWQNIAQSLEYAADTENNRAWIDNQRVLPSSIDESFYLRAAWFKVGMEGVIAHPFGLGYGTDGFGRYIQQRYGNPDFISSHSGWLDFALANGIPGLFLLLGVGCSLIVSGWQSFKRACNAEGVALAFLSLIFFFRGLIDGHFSSSRMIGMALVFGLLLGLCLRKTKDDARISA